MSPVRTSFVFWSEWQDLNLRPPVPNEVRYQTTLPLQLVSVSELGPRRHAMETGARNACAPADLARCWGRRFILKL